MTDELDLLRGANPVPQDHEVWQDGPLDFAAERRLNQLLRSGRVRRARPLTLGVVAAAVAAVTVLTVLLSGTGLQPAVAAPAPIVVRHGAPVVPLDRIARNARHTAEGDSTAPRRQSHEFSWSMGEMESGPGAVPPVTIPEERMATTDADGTMTILVVATDPRHPGRPVITDKDGKPTADGTVVRRETSPVGALGDAGFAQAPPHEAAALRDYLLRGNYSHGSGTSELLDALPGYLGTWTPGPRENAALAQLLADTGDWKPDGAVTDRLGRPGQAFVYDGPGGGRTGVRQMLILDPRTGQVLGLETTFTKDDDEYKVKAGDVMSYEAWLT